MDQALLRKNSAVIKRSIVLDGHKTSVSLENEFWNALREIALRKKETVSTLVGRIDQDRTSKNLSSAIRIFVLDYFRGSPVIAPTNGERHYEILPHARS